MLVPHIPITKIEQIPTKIYPSSLARFLANKSIHLRLVCSVADTERVGYPDFWSIRFFEKKITLLI